MDGSESASSQSAKDLSYKLIKKYFKNITLWDERLSSKGAFNLARNLDVNTSKKIEKLDENAARLYSSRSIRFLSKNNLI